MDSIFSIINITAFLASISIALCEDRIPKEMLLQCEGKSEIFMFGDNKKPEIHDISFNTLLRFKDGTVSESPNLLVGRDCTLKNGIIQCELYETIYLPDFNSTQKRHLGLSIVRETGELHQFIETLSFHGKGTAGKPDGNLRIRQTGVCRSVGKPIF